MTNHEARECFNQMAATFGAKGMADRAAEIEICREYFTNAKFRREMENFMWKQSKHSKGV